MNVHITQQIINHPTNRHFKKNGWKPVFTAPKQAKIVLIGQTPGIQAQKSQLQWNDKSGETLREWLGVTKEEFYE